VVGAASRRINLPQLHSHTGGVFHGGVSELMASCIYQFLRLAALNFLDGVVEVEAAIRRCLSWRHLGVDGIVCLPIPPIGGFKFLRWCRLLSFMH
jgi:hypothetical protein